MPNIQQLSADDRRTLLGYFVNRYTLEQVETLLFVVGINRNTFSANATLPDLCTEVLQYCISNSQLSCLLSEALRDKPEPDVQAIYARCPSCEPGVKVEITIHDAGMQDLASALKAFMEAHGLKPNEVSLVGAAAGSLWMLLSVPAHVADKILAYPVAVLAGGRYHVDSVRAFRTLNPTEQARWQEIARTTPRAAITTLADGTVGVQIAAIGQSATRTVGAIIAGGSGVAQAGLTIGRVLLIFVIVVAGGIGAGIALAPSLALHNNCGTPIPLPTNVPLVGDHIGVGDSNFKILPGDYTITVAPAGDRRDMSITGPVVGTVSIPLDPREQFSVLQDGVSVPIGQRAPAHISVGPNSKVEVTLCTP